jgi:hypothetical protein
LEVKHREGNNIKKGENLKIITLLDFVIPSMPQDIAQGVYRLFYHYCPSSLMHVGYLMMLCLSHTHKMKNVDSKNMS